MVLNPTAFKNTLTAVLILLCIGLITSMAAISFFIHLLALLVTSCWVAKSLRTGSLKGFWISLGPDKFLWSFALVVLVGLAVLPENIPFGARVRSLSELNWIWFFYSLCGAIYYSSIDEKKIYKTLLICGGIIGLFCIFQFLYGVEVFGRNMDKFKMSNGYWRVKGTFSTPMTYAYVSGLLSVSILPFWLNKIISLKIKINYLLLTLYIFVPISCVLTFTRGAWLALLIASCAVFILWDKKLGTIGISCLISVLIFWFGISDAFRNRLISFGATDSFSISERFRLWKANFQMFLDHPLLGIGYNRNSSAILDYSPSAENAFSQMNAHSNYFQVLGGTGGLGFILWISFFIILLWRSIVSYRKSKNNTDKSIHLGFIAGQIFFHIGGLTQTTFADSIVLTLLLLIGSISITTFNKLKAKQLTF